MKRKMMAHRNPAPKTRRPKFKNMAHPTFRTRLAALVAAIMVVAALLSALGVPSASATVTTGTVSAKVMLASGPIEGCPKATVIGPFKVPAEDKNVDPLRLLPKGYIYIVHLWWNNGADSVQGAAWNPGVPTFGQTQIKTMITSQGPWAVKGAGGIIYRYVNNTACRHNLPYEFRNGDQPAVSFWKLQAQDLIIKIN